MSLFISCTVFLINVPSKDEYRILFSVYFLWDYMKFDVTCISLKTVACFYTFFISTECYAVSVLF
jgi:hypothetical protein